MNNVEKRGNGYQKSVLITGASRGIGRALCEEALARGYEVHGLVRNADQAPAGVHAHVADLRDRAAIKALMHELAPKLDWYLANAGIGYMLNPSKPDTADKAAEIMEINGTATVYSIYALAYEWITLGARDKKIGVVSSLAAGLALPKTAIYAASKTAQLIACQGLAYDLAAMVSASARSNPVSSKPICPPIRRSGRFSCPHKRPRAGSSTDSSAAKTALPFHRRRPQSLGFRITCRTFSCARRSGPWRKRNFYD